MQKRLINLAELILESIEEDAKETSNSLKAEGIDLEKTYKAFNEEMARAKNEIELEKDQENNERLYMEG